MTKISCEIIQDLLPLYHDAVCSEESKLIVQEHLQNCPKCTEMLAQMQSETHIEHNLDDVKSMKSISKKIKSDKLGTFILGVFSMSTMISVVCLIIYCVIGTSVSEPDGTLIETFGLVPVAYLFAFVALLSGIILVIKKAVARKKRK